ncbi:DUF559 domain-containing protein, partial [bacterium]|nr:DUF559 domain-containing protein [bacterium]
MDDLSLPLKWKIDNIANERKITFISESFNFQIPYPKLECVQEFKDYAHSFGKIERWKEKAAIDGLKGGAYYQIWERFIASVEEACNIAEIATVENFGFEINFIVNCNYEKIRPVFQRLKDILDKKGLTYKIVQFWVNKIARSFDKSLDVALNSVLVNGHQVQNKQECEVVLRAIDLIEARQKCGRHWDTLLSDCWLPKFTELDSEAPERIAKNYVPFIKRSLDWWSSEVPKIRKYLEDLQIPADAIFDENPLDSDSIKVKKTLEALEVFIPIICDICLTVLQIEDCTKKVLVTKRILESERSIISNTCKDILKAIAADDPGMYRSAYFKLKELFAKYALRKTRSELLEKLRISAPRWAEAIEGRSGVHGKTIVPDKIEEAWKWSQYSELLNDLLSISFEDLQKDSIRLGREYRQLTASFAEMSAWYHLMRRTEGNLDMRMALQGWKQTVKKIGKGTGKNAPRFKAKARELMGKCQAAVPGWIMPMGRALESLNPQVNSFDIVIIDEASQSDISSLAVLYMGKKLIIVGDDKQVSPMAVGLDMDKMSALEDMYINGKIPNSHLYNGRTSIYDIAATVFQPLMLREHFRCVPEIIGFSNMLSYDNKIKPLRDASSSQLLPAVVNYKVEGGRRSDSAKTNPNEAKAIIALMQACMREPEYDGKTFGIISMLGDDQVKLLQKMLFEHIEGRDIDRRRILVGNASNFQGDERDVIFLSLVDSGNKSGPISLMSFGVEDAYRKRYNVATSRARDQLWVVNSLDPNDDLKYGDIRKMLLDYSLSYSNVADHEGVEDSSESLFEAKVVKSLKDRGFHLIRHKQIGTYCLNIVVVHGKDSVIIECDGDRYRSGDTYIREDMERQTILERIGWKFIHIRGSEYFRDPNTAIDRLSKRLEEFGIYPEDEEGGSDSNSDLDLLRRVRSRAEFILYGRSNVNVGYKSVNSSAGTTNFTVSNNELDTSVEDFENSAVHIEEEQ